MKVLKELEQSNNPIHSNNIGALKISIMPASWSTPPELRQMIVKVRYAMVNTVTIDVGNRIDLFVNGRGVGFEVAVGGE